MLNAIVHCKMLSGYVALQHKMSYMEREGKQLDHANRTS